MVPLRTSDLRLAIANRGYNHCMRIRLAWLCLLFPLLIVGQQSTTPADSNAGTSSKAPACGNGPIDEYLAAKKKARRVRNKNPLPNDVCVWSWCRANPNAPNPDNLPTSHPPEDTARPGEPSNESSSKAAPAPHCDIYAAVQDVEVGDFYYDDKSYRAALGRYESALGNKPNDPGIFLRLGKTAEKLGDFERANREFQSSLDAAPDGPTAKEAKAGLERIKARPSK